MRAAICAREDYETQGRLLEALARAGAHPEDDFDLEVPLPSGFLRFRVGAELFDVFSDAWVVELHGPDELVKHLLAVMAEAA